MQRTTTDPDTYLDSLADDVRETMRHLDRLIAGIMTGHSRVLWEGTFWGGTEQTIIGYGDLTMTQSRGRTVEWFMVGLARQKNFYSLYVNAIDGKQYVAEKYAPDLGKIKAGKSSIGFRTLDDVNLDVLAKVIAIARNQLDTSTG